MKMTNNLTYLHIYKTFYIFYLKVRVTTFNDKELSFVLDEAGLDVN